MYNKCHQCCCLYIYSDQRETMSQFTVGQKQRRQNISQRNKEKKSGLVWASALLILFNYCRYNIRQNLVTIIRWALRISFRKTDIIRIKPLEWHKFMRILIVSLFKTLYKIDLPLNTFRQPNRFTSLFIGISNWVFSRFRQQFPQLPGHHFLCGVKLSMAYNNRWCFLLG